MREEQKDRLAELRVYHTANGKTAGYGDESHVEIRKRRNGTFDIELWSEGELIDWILGVDSKTGWDHMRDLAEAQFNVYIEDEPYQVKKFGRTKS